MTNIARFLNHNEVEPWDLLFRDLFKTDSFFLPAINSKPGYPVDIYEDDKTATIEIAAVGLNKEDIQIEETDGLLTVSYEKGEEQNEEKPNYIQRGIAKRSFCLSWKFSDKYNLKKIDATMDKGILKLQIPKKEEKAIVKNTIKIK